MSAPKPTPTRIHLIQGECRVSDDPLVVLTTTLGSCVSACIRDPEAGVGGMNHFLLPDGDEVEGREAIRYGAHAMELLVNGLLRSGAQRQRLQVHLFGGARLTEGLVDVGGKNAVFAVEFLKRENIAFVGGSLRGPYARRIQFWPVSGRVRQMKLARTPALAVMRQSPRSGLAPDHGALQLF